MKRRRISGDLRLALPAAGAWVVLAAVITFSSTSKVISTFAIVFVAVIFGLLGVFLVHQSPTVGLFLFATAGLFISYGLKLSTHIEKVPWIHDTAQESQWWSAWAAELRSQFLTATEQFPHEGGELIPGLAIGDTSRVSESLSTAMKTVSLTHITAVSGANCVIVTATCMALAALFCAHRKLRLVIASCALIAFVILVTPQPSVLRAATMALIVMFAMYQGRPSSGLPLLAIAVLVILIHDPWLSVDYGLILSACATAGLLLFSEPLTRSLARFIPLWLAVVMAVPLSAQLACQPFIIFLTPQFPSYGVLANVVAGPAAPLATIIGLSACLLVMWAPFLAMPLLWIAWLPAQWIGSTANTLSRFPAAQIPWYSGLAGASLMALLSLAVLTALLSSKKPLRRLSAFALSISVVGWGMFNLFQGIAFSNSLPTTWDIAACDVGQGDGLILRSQEQVAVIDVGRKPEPMTRCFNQLGITHIDLLVLTHFDKDHVGGLSSVLGMVEQAVVGKPENSEDEDLLTDLRRAGAEVVRGHSGMRGSLGAANWKVLWPDGKHPSMELGNPGSVTLLVQFPTYNAIFLGDLGQEAQLALMNSTTLPQAQVVKVAHHGSADQSSTLYSALKPEIGILSVGADNDYGHPRQETLDILTKLHADSPRTDEEGLVLIRSTSTGLSVWTEH